MRLLWSASAARDVDRLWRFLAERNVDHADRVEERIRARAESLIAHPAQGRLVPGRAERELSIPDVQYVIVYTPEQDHVRILRIWATRQRRGES